MLIAHHRKSRTVPGFCTSIIRCASNPTKYPPLGVNNIPHITETKYCDALQAYLVVVTDLYVSCLTPPPGELSSENKDRFSTFSWLERACFGLVAFVMQCEFLLTVSVSWHPAADKILLSVTLGSANTIESVFGDARTTNISPAHVDLALSILAHHSRIIHSTIDVPGNRDIVGISVCYSACFLIQVKISLKLHSDERAGQQHSLLPPSLPPMDTASSYDRPDKIGSTTSLWPWLQSRLAGTPLAGLSFTSGCRWQGYYTASPDDLRDPPMFFNMYLAPPPSTDEAANKVYFRGEGTEGANSFTLRGAVDTDTGVVKATRTYGNGGGFHQWNWYGVITPFGMVGTRGVGAVFYGNGWWWIWPQEWSERSPALPATATP